MASQTTLTDVVKLSEAQYATLKANGNITVGGITVPYSDTTLYLTEGVADDTSTLNSNSVVVTDNLGNTITSGVTVTELNQLDNVRSNIQKLIDDLKELISNNNYAVYFGNTVDDIDENKPGTYYVPSLTNPDLYDQYLVTEDGDIKLIARSIPAEQVGDKELSAYQTRIDAVLTTRNNTGDNVDLLPNKRPKITTVVGAINELDAEMGDAWPLDTTAQTVSAAINELANRTVTGDVEIDGVGVIKATVTGDGYEISHVTAQTGSSTTIGQKTNDGHWKFPAGLKRDAYGHFSSSQTLVDMYIPLAKGDTNGLVWTWDADNEKGYWGEPAVGGDAVQPGTGLKLNGTKIDHTNVPKTTADANINTGVTYGNTTAVPTLKLDSTGHISSIIPQAMYPPITAGNENEYWKSLGASRGTWTAAVNDANTIVENSKPNTLVNSNAINDIMSGMRIVRLSQTAYDDLGAAVDDNTIYFIVG